MPETPLILASGSPRRREILTAAGIPFTVRVAGVAEETLPEEAPQDYVPAAPSETPVRDAKKLRLHEDILKSVEQELLKFVQAKTTASQTIS